MKKTFTLLSALTLALSSSSLAEGKGGGNGFNDAAQKYEQKAADARANGNHEAARIYSRMAQIKRDAATGTLKNWDEYHKLNKRLGEVMGWNKEKGKCEDKDHKKKKGIGKYQDKSKKWDKHKAKKKTKSATKKTSTKSAGKFEKQAKNHLKQANQAMEDGNAELSNLHQELAQLLINASIKAQRGQEPDLDAYFKLQQQLFQADTADDEENVENW